MAARATPPKCESGPVPALLRVLQCSHLTHPHSDPYVTMCLGCFFLTSFPVAQLSPTYQVSYSLGMGCFLFWLLLSGDYPGTSLPLFRSLVRRSAQITLFKTSQSPQTFTTIYIKYLSTDSLICFLIHEFISNMTNTNKSSNFQHPTKATIIFHFFN